MKSNKWIAGLLIISCLDFGDSERGKSNRTPEVPSFKVGLLAPWNQSFDDFSALTSASAISIAIEAIHADPTLNTRMKFRCELFGTKS